VDPTADRVASLPLAAAVVLGALAGYVDAVCFGHLFEVFPVNQSGNIIFFGVAIGDSDGSALWPSATAMAGFALGAGASSIVRRAAGPVGRNQVLLAIEAALLAVVAVAVGSITEVTALLGGAKGFLVLLGLAVAMGVQTEVLTAHAGVSISTTYQTGALTHLAEDVAAAATRLGDSRPRGRAMGILTLVLGGYIGGAAIGARLVSSWGGVLIVPIAVLVALALSEPWWSERRARGR
jgi:uncharacterized membrane protein YoaK (UPF0700 family)